MLKDFDGRSCVQCKRDLTREELHNDEDMRGYCDECMIKTLEGLKEKGLVKFVNGKISITKKGLTETKKNRSS